MEDMKKCAKCLEYKPFSEFNKCKKGRLGLHNHCRSCQKIVRHEWYLAHRTEQIQDAKIWSKSEDGREARKNYWKTKKHILGPAQNLRRRSEAAKIKARAQRKAWLAIPQNKIACSLRGRIRIALKGISKLKSTEVLTGCSYEQLRLHLESLFLPNMTWDNYGEWHIDHIRPCASFDLSDPRQQIECFHYTNLQPLWAKDNLSKGASINP